MDPLGTAEMVFQSILESEIEFKNVDYKWLVVYLFLVLGEDCLREYGLATYIPRKKIRGKRGVSQAKSLAARGNRSLDNWWIELDNIGEKEKRTMLALMMKISILVLMDSTCYMFGGEIFKQVCGAGIGLRASACAAKIVMGKMDILWAKIQLPWHLKVQIFLRYIDDLRIFMKPLRKGWRWTSEGWAFDDSIEDNRSPMARTCEEIAKSLNDVVSFLQFTTESEEDFLNGFLPTLDTQTKVLDNGEIQFKFFRKPMANNIMIQFGTALPRNTVFSSLRQELVRRMLNTSLNVEWDDRLQIIEEFIQLLVNSKHSFPFIKALCLQALTKYRTMVHRSQLPLDDPKAMPLYRPRSFREKRRTLAKYVESMNWFKGGELIDPYRNDWKKKLHGNQRRMKTNKCGTAEGIDKRQFDCVMFVPQSRDSRLFNMISEVERGQLGENSN